MEATVVGLLALAVRLVHLDHTPFIDEMNHVLAAQSLLQDGDLAILDGEPYSRAWLFTYIVAGFYRLFGVSLTVGRIPAVLAGVALVVLFFVWVRRAAGPIAGWTAALILTFAPISIYLSQWVRFYTLHALAFWVFAYCVYRLTEGGPRVRLALVGGAALALAAHLQEITLIGFGGVVAWLGIVYGPALVAGWWRSQHRAWIGAAVVAGVALVVAAVLASGFLSDALTRFRFVDHWALGRAGNERFYHQLLEDQYGLLWALWPLALLLALVRYPKMASLFATVFLTGLVAHSLAAWKSERYVFYLLPAMFAVWGLALAVFVPWVAEQLRSALRGWPVRIPQRIGGTMVAAVLVFIGLFAAGGVEAFRLSRSMMLEPEAAWTDPPGHLGERYRGWPDWAAADAVLDPVADTVGVVVASNALNALYYLERIDYVLYAGRLGASEESRRPDFSPDRKVGRPTISSVESLSLLMDCVPTGLLVVETHVWGWSEAVPDSTAAFVETHLEALSLPPDAGIVGYEWHSRHTSQGAEEYPDPRCANVRGSPYGGPGPAAGDGGSDRSGSGA